MKKAVTILLTVLLALMLIAFAFAVPNGALKDDARERYMDDQNSDSDDSWLLDF